MAGRGWIGAEFALANWTWGEFWENDLSFGMLGTHTPTPTPTIPSLGKFIPIRAGKLPIVARLGEKDFSFGGTHTHTIMNLGTLINCFPSPPCLASWRLPFGAEIFFNSANAGGLCCSFFPFHVAFAAPPFANFLQNEFLMPCDSHSLLVHGLHLTGSL